MSLAVMPRWRHDSTLVAAADQVSSREIDGELVIYHPDTDEVTHLDVIAAQVWLRLETGVSVEALISGLVKDFTADRATISADVEELLDVLLDARLIDVT